MVQSALKAKLRIRIGVFFSYECVLVLILTNVDENPCKYEACDASILWVGNQRKTCTSILVNGLSCWKCVKPYSIKMTIASDKCAAFTESDSRRNTQELIPDHEVEDGYMNIHPRFQIICFSYMYDAVFKRISCKLQVRMLKYQPTWGICSGERCIFSSLNNKIFYWPKSSPLLFMWFEVFADFICLAIIDVSFCMILEVVGPGSIWFYFTQVWLG